MMYKKWKGKICMLLQVDRKFYMDARKAKAIKKERLEMRNLKNVIEYRNL